MVWPFDLWTLTQEDALFIGVDLPADIVIAFTDKPFIVINIHLESFIVASYVVDVFLLVIIIILISRQNKPLIDIAFLTSYLIIIVTIILIILLPESEKMAKDLENSLWNIVLE